MKQGWGEREGLLEMEWPLKASASLSLRGRWAENPGNMFGSTTRGCSSGCTLFPSSWNPTVSKFTFFRRGSQMCLWREAALYDSRRYRMCDVCVCGHVCVCAIACAHVHMTITDCNRHTITDWASYGMGFWAFKSSTSGTRNSGPRRESGRAALGNISSICEHKGTVEARAQETASCFKKGRLPPCGGLPPLFSQLRGFSAVRFHMTCTEQRRLQRKAACVHKNIPRAFPRRIRGRPLCKTDGQVQTQELKQGQRRVAW